MEKVLNFLLRDAVYFPVIIVLLILVILREYTDIKFLKDIAGINSLILFVYSLTMSIKQSREMKKVVKEEKNLNK
ncbi:hypothetical protein IV49_GL000822 [Kandleria vitulina DSM 20405]|jgi:hypothetical protein|uniref:Uncharacterized protein n=1 Tax=Kandleria vitulina DSM 20405 TaxID=1410657 RepID=A0A0R2HA59_9FIRM|nr:hypothetical protein [Kandleria vitulina]KRN49777.1 hypothetical protein IV49_GL000822 [Kandleria vitulina DSM 20405]